MRKIVLLLLSVLLGTGLLPAQSPTRVRGTVTDAETGEPMPYVSVIFLGTRIGTMTDAGIKDCHIALLMVDKNDPDNQVMKVGTYRIFKDKDGLAEPSSWSSRTTDRQSLGTGLSSIIAAE